MLPNVFKILYSNYAICEDFTINCAIISGSFVAITIGITITIIGITISIVILFYPGQYSSLFQYLSLLD